MNYIKFLFDYTYIFKQLIDEKKKAIPRQLLDGFIEFAEEDHQRSIYGRTSDQCNTPRQHSIFGATFNIWSRSLGKLLQLLSKTLGAHLENKDEDNTLTISTCLL